MLTCLACRRHDGDHALNCSYLAGYEDSELARAFMDDNAELFESERLTHPIGGGPRRAPSQTTDEFLLAILAEPSHLERYEHSMAVADPDDAFEVRIRALMAELNRLDAASLKATNALISWPEAES